MSLREQILGADDRPIRYVDVPAWGCRVGVRAMRIADREAIEADSLAAGEDPAKRAANVRNWRARLLVRCLVDDSGELLFGPDDIAALSQRSACVIDRLTDVALAVNKMQADDVEELEKNSDATQNGVFVSA